MTLQIKPKQLSRYIILIAVFVIHCLCKISVTLAENQDFEELVVGLKVNYVETELVSNALKTPRNDILVPIADLSSFQIRTDYLERAKATINQIDYVNLGQLQNIDYKIDEENMILIINFPPAAMPPQNVSIWHEQNETLEGYRGTPIKSFFANYDLTVTHQKKQYFVVGVQELNYSAPNYSINQTVLTRKNLFTGNRRNTDKTSITRLDTAWISDNEESIAKWKIGDSITGSADWSSSTRFGGIQYATDFTLRPNLITYPLVNFAGRADLPSALDIYANSKLLYKTELNTGDFNMNNLPVSVGRGALEIKQRDITGKLQTIAVPYYISPALLKSGLTDYSFEVGSQRVGYGAVSNKYRYFVTSFDYNKGMNSNWTSGVHFESMKDIFAIGATNLYQIGNYGVVSASLATSGPRLAKAQKLMLGYSFQGQIFGFSFNQMISGQNFLNTFNLDSAGVRKSSQSTINYALTKKSSIGLSYLNLISQSTDGSKNATELLSLNYQNNITKNTSLTISAGTDLKNKGNEFISLSLGLNLGDSYVNANTYNQDKAWAQQVGIASTSRQYNGTSYRANFTKDSKWTYDTTFAKAFPKAETTLFMFEDAGGSVQQVDFTGAVAATSEGVFFTRTISDSFAIAKVGNFKNVDVYHNNQFIDKTNAKGVVFVPSIPSYIDSRIRLDEQTLPLSAAFSDTTFIVNPKRKSGVVANFDITRAHIAEMQLVDTAGVHLEQDADVKVEGIEDELFVGYDGKVYIPNLRDLKQVKGAACKNENCCHFDIPIEGMENIEIIDLGVQKCQ
jgi:outer membrane usher protein